MEINGFDRDMAKMFELTAQRADKIAAAPATFDSTDPINVLASRLHPELLQLTVTNVIEETATTRTYRLKAAAGAPALPYFRAGQYISVKETVGGVRATRPYSLSSAPYQAELFYELTIRRKEGGFMSGHIWENWREGTDVEASGPHGTFYHEPLRDGNTIIALAGGSGITPFRSMAREIAAGKSGLEMILIYGSRGSEDIIFEKELRELSQKNPDRIKVTHVLSDPQAGWQGRTGLIDAALIRDAADDKNGASFFICGPPAMYDYCLDQLSSLAAPRRLIRRELAGSVDDITTEPGYPADVKEKRFSITVSYRGRTKTLPAPARETVLTALEKAGLEPESQCRSGECGFCRALLLAGRVFTRPDGDGRRAADRKYGYIHPCSSYPLTDLELLIP